MSQEPRTDRKPSGANSREQRLKAALKANMGRRKAQAQARRKTDADDSAGKNNETPGGTTGADNDLE